MSKSSSHDVSFDILRVAAISYILTSHLSGYSRHFRNMMSSHGCELGIFCSLALLCYLSGFLMGANYKLTTWADCRRFLKKRIVRIYPMYLIALALFGAVGYIGLTGGIGAALLLNILRGQDLLTLWFVPMIMMLYLLTPVYLKNFSPAKSVTITLIVYIGIRAVHSQFGLVDLRLARYLLCFAAGILASRSRFERPSWALGCSVGCFVAFSYLYVSNAGRVYGPIIDLGILSSIPPLVWIGKRMENVVNARAIELVSYSTFAIYLIHRPVFKVVLHFYQPVEVAAEVVYFLFVLVPIAIIAGYNFQKYYDLLIAKLPARMST